MVTPCSLSPLRHYAHAPAFHHIPLVSPKCSNDGEEELRALGGSEHFSQEPHYIRDDTIDASPGLHLNNVHDSEDDVPTISNTKEFYEEQDEKENVVARSKKKLFSPTEEALLLGSTTTWHCGGHLCRTPCGSQFPLTNISCQSPNVYHTHKCTYNVIQDYMS
jgi:hypothetical protein